MCGIAGFFGIALPEAEAALRLRAMLAGVAHRGPDQHGTCVAPGLGLAVARLAVVEPAAGRQPMVDETGRWALAFNGEVYNHVELRRDLESVGRQFRTRSDTEVLLAALAHWGTDALDRLEGPYALIFADRRDHKVLMARDRFGERPLHYVRQGDGVVAASEIKSLFAWPGIERQLDGAAIQRVSQLWVNLPGETCFQGIAAVPPGHRVEWTPGRFGLVASAAQTSRHGLAIGAAEAAQQVRAALTASIHVRASRCDAPLGVYLSGGLDSTIVAAVAASQRTRLPSFSVAFEDEGFDETDYQDEVARRFGLDHHRVRVSQADISAAFPQAILHAETVQFRSAAAPMLLLSRQVAAAGVKAVVSGEGADEIFLGYDMFKETMFRGRLSELNDDEALAELRALHPYLAHLGAGAGASMLAFYRSFATEKIPGLFSHEVRFAAGGAAQRLFSQRIGADQGPQALAAWLRRRYPEMAELEGLRQAQLVEFETLLAGYLLTSQGDRMMAAHGVEGRCPFLDSAVVDLGWQLPDHLCLAADGTEKAVLKDAFAGLIPDRIRERRKQPYRAPDAVCFLSAVAADWVADLLAPSSLKQCPVIDPVFAERYVQKLRATLPHGIAPRDDQMFMVLLSALLLQHMFVDDYAPPVPVPEDSLAVNLRLGAWRDG
ncbi:asparagine synthase (glutamine-hydrolyzing) [Magnetospirillum moscoviense]|uniref:asparagine synthase (glutamine-hydrolyzing) n=1 Tax=Magnetospirillum moscoviense TaxID=1437059 RepID=A0A178MW66_9PROT|nr:asparagine synthase (glutamine-hydrolyzing) [Magnetospirillum moscoviense]OAN55072.1 hypothetical protein A6A05_00490 [Magnetospirillum moscoviense]